MQPQEIANLFPTPDSNQDAYDYLLKENLLDDLSLLMKANSNRIAPDYNDLARLHQTIRSRRVFTSLEFGLGYSTIVIGDAIRKNSYEWTLLPTKPDIRNETLFQAHSIDTSSYWINQTKTFLPSRVAEVTTIHHSTASAGTFQDRICHYYDCLPNVIPDFIYLDGPDPFEVIGDIVGLSWQNRDRCVMAGDILRMEPCLLPGTLVIADGRTANAFFLKDHLYRNWQVVYNSSNDITVMELQDHPLGKINLETLLYCIGERVLYW